MADERQISATLLEEMAEAPPFGVRLSEFWLDEFGLSAQLPPGFEIPSKNIIGVKPPHWIRAGARHQSGKKVFDAYCGSGAAAVVLAQDGCSVEAADIDADLCRVAAGNAKRAGCGDSVFIRHERAFDAFERVRGRIDWCYLDPPWGKSCLDRSRYGIDDFETDAGELVLRLVESRTPFCLSVPLNFDFERFREFARDFHVEWHEIYGSRCAATIIVSSIEAWDQTEEREPW